MLHSYMNLFVNLLRQTRWFVGKLLQCSAIRLELKQFITTNEGTVKQYWREICTFFISIPESYKMVVLTRILSILNRKAKKVNSWEISIKYSIAYANLVRRGGIFFFYWFFFIFLILLFWDIILISFMSISGM